MLTHNCVYMIRSFFFSLKQTDTMISRLFVAAAACAGFSAPAVDAKKIFWVPFPGSVSHHMLAAKVG